MIIIYILVYGYHLQCCLYRQYNLSIILITSCADAAAAASAYFYFYHHIIINY